MLVKLHMVILLDRYGLCTFPCGINEDMIRQKVKLFSDSFCNEIIGYVADKNVKECNIKYIHSSIVYLFRVSIPNTTLQLYTNFTMNCKFILLSVEMYNEMVIRYRCGNVTMSVLDKANLMNNHFVKWAFS